MESLPVEALNRDCDYQTRLPSCSKRQPFAGLCARNAYMALTAAKKCKASCCFP